MSRSPELAKCYRTRLPKSPFKKGDLKLRAIKLGLALNLWKVTLGTKRRLVQDSLSGSGGAAMAARISRARASSSWATMRRTPRTNWSMG